MLAPIAPAPATTMRATSRAPTSRPTSASAGAPARPHASATPTVREADLRRRLERESLQRRAHLSHVARALPDEPGHELREDRRQPRDRPGRPALEPATTSDSAPTNTSSPSIRYGSTSSNGWFETLRPATIRRQLAHALDRPRRNRVPGSRAKLVEVERQRSAGLGGRGEMADERLLVERVVRRPDHRDRVRTVLGCVSRECNRLGRRLSTAVNGDVEPVYRPHR